MNTYATSSPAATTGGQGNIPPVCQNCATSTTPLWRRDEVGSVLCNACGLFLKLHGTPRPISLKTDVIKSRNRVKTGGQGQKKKPLFDGNGLPVNQPETGTPPPNQLNNNRRVSHKTSSGGSDPSNSPISRTETPALHHPSNIAPQHIFDGATLTDHTFQSPAMPSLQLRHPSPGGSTSSMNDRHLEPPPTYDALIQINTALRTRVTELEVINDLYREHSGAPQAEMISQDSNSQYRQMLDQEQREKEALKRQVEELEREVAELRGEQPPAKRVRVSDASEYPEPPQGFAANGLHA